jgi:hypothetical protein
MLSRARGQTRRSGAFGQDHAQASGTHEPGGDGQRQHTTSSHSLDRHWSVPSFVVCFGVFVGACGRRPIRAQAHVRRSSW